MLFGLHAISILHTNTLTDMRIARDVGYDALELWVPKLERYLDAGHGLDALPDALGPVRVGSVNCLADVGSRELAASGQLAAACTKLCGIAQTLGCGLLQASVAGALPGEDWPATRARIIESLAHLADLAAEHDVRLVVEPQAFAPMRTLAQALEVLDAAGRDNVGLCMDTFHLWAGGTPWEEVAAVDRALIDVVHLSDVTPRKGDQWSDDDRDVLPGDGILPLAEAIAALRKTGFDGLWSVEMLGAHHWEWDPVVLAAELKRRTEALLAG